MAKKKTNVTSYNQSGGITAHTVTVNMAPQAAVKHEVIESTREGSEYVTKVLLTLTNAQAAKGLQVVAEASSLLDLALQPEAGGGMFNTLGPATNPALPNVMVYQINSPPTSDRYVATIRTDQPEAVGLAVDFNPQPLI